MVEEANYAFFLNTRIFQDLATEPAEIEWLILSRAWAQTVSTVWRSSHRGDFNFDRAHVPRQFLH